MTKFAKVQGAFELIDCMGVAPSLNFNGQSVSKSMCGGIITVILVFLGVGSTILFSQELFYKQKPSVIVSKSTEPVAPRVQMNAGDDIKAAIAMFDPETFAPFVNLSLYGAQATYYQLNSITEQFDAIELNMTVCTAELAGPMSQAIGNAWCLGKIDDYDVILEDWSGQGIIYSLFVCDEALANKTGVPCADDATISDAFSIAYAGIFYTQLAIQPSNLEEPFKYQGNGELYSIDISKRLTARITFGEVEVNTDTGFYLEDIKTETMYGVTLGAVQQEYDTVLGHLNLYMYSGNDKTTYERSYKKVQDVLAEINGFLALILICAQIFLKAHLENNFYEKAINESYQVSLNYKSKSNEKCVHSQRNLNSPNSKFASQKENFQDNGLPPAIIDENEGQNLKRISQENLDEDSQNIQLNLNQARLEIHSFDFKNFHANRPSNLSNNGGAEPKTTKETSNDNQKSKLQINFVEWLASFVPRSQSRAKVKSKMLAKGKDRIDKQLDILYIIKKLQEIDKLKSYLLTNNQIMLFEGLPKPKLEVREDSAVAGLLGNALQAMADEGIDEEKKRNAIHEAYKTLKEQEVKLKTDENLMKDYERAYGIGRSDSGAVGLKFLGQSRK